MNKIPQIEAPLCRQPALGLSRLIRILIGGLPKGGPLHRVAAFYFVLTVFAPLFLSAQHPARHQHGELSPKHQRQLDPNNPWEQTTASYYSLRGADAVDNLQELPARLPGLLPTWKAAGFDLQLQHDLRSPGGRHLTYQFLIDELPVYGMQLKVNLDRQHQPFSVLVSRWPEQAPLLGELTQNPQTLWEQRYQAQYGGKLHHSQPMAWWNGQTYRRSLVLTTAEDRQGGSHDLVLDGETGDLLYTSLRSSFFTRDTTVPGYVFDPDPLTTARLTYGGVYVDNNDADTSFLNAERVRVDLQDIEFDNSSGVYTLAGPHVVIADRTPPSTQVPANTTGVFDYTRGQIGFEAVMAYYHVDNYQRYIQQHGFDSLARFPLDVDPYGFTADNSSFTPLGLNSYIALGTGGVDDAEDADVIIHEYGHAISHAAAPGTNNGIERRGFDEGVGDYVATSYSRQTNDFRWQDVFNWDGHNEFWPGRSATVSYDYDNLPNRADIYQFGEVWNSSMQLLANALGFGITDSLMFQTLYASTSNMSLFDAARNLLDAEEMFFGGQYRVQVAEALDAYKLCESQRCRQAVSLDVARKGSGASWRVYPNPSSRHVQVELAQPAPPGAELVVFDLQGRRLLSAPLAPRQPTRLQLDTLSPGTYLLRVLGLDYDLSRRLVVQPN